MGCRVAGVECQGLFELLLRSRQVSLIEHFEFPKCGMGLRKRRIQLGRLESGGASLWYVIQTQFEVGMGLLSVCSGAVGI